MSRLCCGWRQISQDYLISEYDEPQIVDVVHVVLLNVDTVHVHQNVSDHNHGRLVVVPGLVQNLQEVVVQRREDVLTHLDRSDSTTNPIKLIHRYRVREMNIEKWTYFGFQVQCYDFLQSVV